MERTQPDAAHEPQSVSVRRIRRIAKLIDATSYLEIGVNRGATFNALQFERKVAVDPNFLFEVSEFRKEGVEFHAMESDRYFTDHGASRKFDIIFIDGLHTFQQTFRDFCNSLCCSHDRTVWLIDDVFPSDVYSAWQNQREAIEFRRRAGGGGIKWHGDVFKVLFVIHDYFPLLSYITLREGNAQSIVWKSPRDGFSRAFAGLEAIERLGYFDLLRKTELLNLMPEALGFRQFTESVSSLRQEPGRHDRERTV
jgi:hypothetical protein